MSSRSVRHPRRCSHDVIAQYSQAAHLAFCCDCAFAEQNKLRLLYRGSKDGVIPKAFWQRCEGKANTLTVVKVSCYACLAELASSASELCTHFIASAFVRLQVKESGNVFAIFFPVAWPAGLSGQIADPSGRTFIVSLVNKHGRSCRLKFIEGHNAFAALKSGYGPAFGNNGHDLRLMVHGQGHCMPQSFELDAEVESKAGLPKLPFAYDCMLLSGVNDTPNRYYQQVQQSNFTPAEIECYTLDA